MTPVPTVSTPAFLMSSKVSASAARGQSPMVSPADSPTKLLRESLMKFIMLDSSLDVTIK